MAVQSQTLVFSPTACINANQSLIKFCLPERIVCAEQLKNGRFTDNEWNCSLTCQTDIAYFQPYIPGDKIQFQTIFYSGSPNNPTPFDSIATVELCTEEGTTPLVAQKMSGWKDKRPFQILELDTSGLTGCFSLKYTLADGTVCKTEHFRQIDDCKETILIQSKRNSRDCFGYCYGPPDSFVGDELEYNNALRYCGFIKPAGVSNTCLLYTSPSPRDATLSRMPSSA